MKKSIPFNKKAPNYYLATPKKGAELSTHSKFIEHISKHYPSSSLILAREMLTGRTVFDDVFDKSNEQIAPAHLLLRITENHPLLALPLVIDTLAQNPYARDPLDTALRFCATKYPEQTAQLLENAISTIHDAHVGEYLYGFMYLTGYDINDDLKKLMVNHNQREKEEERNKLKQNTYPHISGEF